MTLNLIRPIPGYPLAKKSRFYLPTKPKSVCCAWRQRQTGSKKMAMIGQILGRRQSGLGLILGLHRLPPSLRSCSQSLKLGALGDGTATCAKTSISEEAFQAALVQRCGYRRVLQWFRVELHGRLCFGSFSTGQRVQGLRRLEELGQSCHVMHAILNAGRSAR